ncbi:N-acetyltransferase [Clostridium perfringens]|uniref:N-acetyltransferase n=1 Tax=Clostridium perfringens TaxID=1502 RepID=UPI003A0FC91A
MLDTVSLDENRERLERIGFKIMYKNKDGYSYRLSKDDFNSQIKDLKERKFGIFIYDKMVVSTVISFLEIFHDINKSLDKEIISVELVGTKNNIIKDRIYDIKFENVKSIEEVDLDVIIVPGSKSNKFYENEEFEKLLNNINGCETVCVLGNSIIPFIKNKFLRGLKAYYSKEWVELIKEELALTSYSDEDIIDNGRLIMVKKKSCEIEGIKYIIKKLFGESVLNRFDL